MDDLRLIKLQEALDKLHSRWRPLIRTERVKLIEALGRVLGVDVESPMDLPPFHRSAVDGYAVKAEDTFNAGEENPVELRLAFKVPIGTLPKQVLNKGECAYVSTGSLLPPGSDAVVMLEYTHVEDGKVKVYRPVTPGENMVRKGADVKKGSRILRKGVKLTPRRLGLLASIGLAEVEVFVKPRVAVISTGPELVEPGVHLVEGKIYDVNTTTLLSMAIEAGAEAKALGIVPDNLEELVEKLKEALQSFDLVLVSGGTSKGEVDLLPRAIASLSGAVMVAHGLAIKPGKPTLIALVEDKPIIGLPGNPTSAMLVFHVLVKPLIQEMAESSEEERTSFIEAKASVKIFSAKGRREFKFMKLEVKDGQLYAYPLPTGSEAVTTYASADGFIEIPEEVEFVEEGEKLLVKLLR